MITGKEDEGPKVENKAELDKDDGKEKTIKRNKSKKDLFKKQEKKKKREKRKKNLKYILRLLCSWLLSTTWCNCMEDKQ